MRGETPVPPSGGWGHPREWGVACQPAEGWGEPTSVGGYATSETLPQVKERMRVRGADSPCTPPLRGSPTVRSKRSEVVDLVRSNASKSSYSVGEPRSGGVLGEPRKWGTQVPAAGAGGPATLGNKVPAEWRRGAGKAGERSSRRRRCLIQTKQRNRLIITL